MMKTLNNILNQLDTKSFENIFEHCIDPVVITDAYWKDGIKIIYTNRAFNTISQYSSNELIGKSPKIFQGTKSNYKVLSELKTELIKGNSFVGQSVNYKKDKTSYIVKWSISPIKNKDGKVIAYISFQKAIDSIVNMEQEKLLSKVVNASENLILVTNLESVIVYLNDAFSDKLGYGKEELLGKHTRVLKSGRQDDIFYKNMWNTILKDGKFSDIFISKKKNGTLFYDKKDISTIKDNDGNPIYYVSTSIDISNQVQKEQLLQNELYIDTLTNIYNRKKYEEIIQKKIKEYSSNKKVFSLILIDIDHFKYINDNYGHDIGDYILQEFTKVINQNIRESDMFFRWGGEEFVVLVDIDDDSAFNLAQKLRIEILSKNFQSIKITASFAISQITLDDTQNSIFKKADSALYEAKQTGRNKVVISK